MIDEQPHERPIDDMVYSLLKFRNGARGIVVAGIQIPYTDNDVVIYGTKGRLVCKGTLGTPQRGTPRELIFCSEGPETRTEFPTENAQQASMARLIEDFNRSILENTEPALSGHNGLQMVKIAAAMLESGRRGMAVTVN